ncbi:MAG: Crp/Fnr family transcriptional regulator [Chloroflexota bacterium]
MTRYLDSTTLGDLALFQGLELEQIEQLSHLMHRKTFVAGTPIIAAEEPGDAAYIILSGTVKIHAEQPDGSTVILSIFGAGEIVGEMSVIDNIGRSATVVTLETSTLLAINREAFDRCLQTMPIMTYNLVRILSRRLRISGAQVQAIATLDVFGRVARQLLTFAQEYGQTTHDKGVLIPLRLTQSDLADLVGASRVRVNQVLVFFKQQQYISVDSNNRITILDPEALLQRCQ